MPPPSLLSARSLGRATSRQAHYGPPCTARSISKSIHAQATPLRHEMTTTTTPTPTPTPRARLANAALSLALAFCPPVIAPTTAYADTLPPTEQQAALPPPVQSASYVADGARMLSAQDQTRMAQRLAQLDQQNNWRVRVVTVDGLSAKGGRESARAALGLPSYASSLPSFDRRTVVLQADPTAPALLSIPYVGDDALKLLGRPFFTELESRFGNLYYSRENGSPKALRDAVATLELCLARDPPCRVVPGLPDEQLAACLTFAIAGGIIAGGASKIKGGSGPLQWVLLFAPLWFSLVFSFGVGPVVSRLEPGEREAPLAKVLGAFAVSAVLPWAPEILGTRRPAAGGDGGGEGGM